jgi:hypothetical protein
VRSGAIAVGVRVGFASALDEREQSNANSSLGYVAGVRILVTLAQLGLVSSRSHDAVIEVLFAISTHHVRVGGVRNWGCLTCGVGGTAFLPFVDAVVNRAEGVRGGPLVGNRCRAVLGLHFLPKTVTTDRLT